jgi:peptidoglycan hydrolase CwlO-like protein
MAYQWAERQHGLQSDGEKLQTALDHVEQLLARVSEAEQSKGLAEGVATELRAMMHEQAQQTDSVANTLMHDKKELEAHITDIQGALEHLQQQHAQLTGSSQRSLDVQAAELARSSEKLGVCEAALQAIKMEHAVVTAEHSGMSKCLVLEESKGKELTAVLERVKGEKATLKERLAVLDQLTVSDRQQHYDSMQQLTLHCQKLQESKAVVDQESSDMEKSHTKQAAALQSSHTAQEKALSQELSRMQAAHADVAKLRGGERAAHATAVKEWSEARTALEGQVAQLTSEHDRTVWKLGQREALLLEARSKYDKEHLTTTAQLQELNKAKADLIDRMSAVQVANERQSKELRYVIEQREDTILHHEKALAESGEKLKRVLATITEQQDQLTTSKTAREELELELERRGKHHTGEFRSAVQGKEEAAAAGKVATRELDRSRAKVRELEDAMAKMTTKESELREARKVLITDRRKVDNEVAALHKELKRAHAVAGEHEVRAEKLRSSLEAQELRASEQVEAARMKHKRAAEELRATVRSETLAQQEEHAAMTATLLEARRGLEKDLEKLHEAHEGQMAELVRASQAQLRALQETVMGKKEELEKAQERFSASLDAQQEGRRRDVELLSENHKQTLTALTADKETAEVAVAGLKKIVEEEDRRKVATYRSIEQVLAANKDLHTLINEMQSDGTTRERLYEEQVLSLCEERDRLDQASRGLHRTLQQLRSGDGSQSSPHGSERSRDLNAEVRLAARPMPPSTTRSVATRVPSPPRAARLEQGQQDSEVLRNELRALAEERYRTEGEGARRDDGPARWPTSWSVETEKEDAGETETGTLVGSEFAQEFTRLKESLASPVQDRDQGSLKDSLASFRTSIEPHIHMNG